MGNGVKISSRYHINHTPPSLRSNNIIKLETSNSTCIALVVNNTYLVYCIYYEFPYVLSDNFTHIDGVRRFFQKSFHEAFVYLGISFLKCYAVVDAERSKVKLTDTHLYKSVRCIHKGCRFTSR